MINQAAIFVLNDLRLSTKGIILPFIPFSQSLVAEINQLLPTFKKLVMNEINREL